MPIQYYTYRQISNNILNGIFQIVYSPFALKTKNLSGHLFFFKKRKKGIYINIYGILYIQIETIYPYKKNTESHLLSQTGVSEEANPSLSLSSPPHFLCPETEGFNRGGARWRDDNRPVRQVREVYKVPGLHIAGKLLGPPP